MLPSTLAFLTFHLRLKVVRLPALRPVPPIHSPPASTFWSKASPSTLPWWVSLASCSLNEGKGQCGEIKAGAEVIVVMAKLGDMELCRSLGRVLVPAFWGNLDT